MKNKQKGQQQIWLSQPHFGEFYPGIDGIRILRDVWIYLYLLILLVSKYSKVNLMYYLFSGTYI